MTPGMQHVLQILAPRRFHLEDEKRTQSEIEAVFASHPGFAFEREVHVAGGIIDFLAGDTGIEVKLKGQAAQIIRQLAGYAQDPGISGLVLVSAKPIALPVHLHGKPLALVNLVRAWL